jgi:hypothetical protein
MVKRDFQFDVAISSALTGWVKSNIFLSSATAKPETLFQWKKSELVVNLDGFSDEYCQKFIDSVFIDYCDKLLIAIKKPLAEFLISYSFPSIIIHILFKYGGLTLGKTLTIHPELDKYPKMKIS